MRSDKERDTFAQKIFRSSRLAEFATHSELIRQTGHPAEDWPLVIVKELADNALDAGGRSGDRARDRDRRRCGRHHGQRLGSWHRARHCRIADRLFGQDACRAAYVSPTRGAQGNAMQTILAIPFVLAQGQQGEVLIQSQGIAHTVRFAVDPVRQTPVVSRNEEPSEVKNGTRITVGWPDSV
jgi:hypothetical protein